MDTSRCQYDVKQEQRAVTGLVAANESTSVDHGRKWVNMVKVGFNQDIPVVCWVSGSAKDKDPRGRMPRLY